jgi:hypothetical protein
VHRHLQQSVGAILRTVLYESCPEELDGFDCGIFAVTVCLHLLEQKSVDQRSFSQGHATEAWTLLSANLCDKFLATLGLHVADKDEMDTSKRNFRGCFPLLSGNCISFDGSDKLRAEYPPIPTRRITTPTTVTMSQTRGAKSKSVVRKKVAVKKVKRELKVKTNSDADIVVDKTGTTEVKLTKVVLKCPIRKAVEEHNECDREHLDSDSDSTVSIETVGFEEVQVLVQEAVNRLIAKGEFAPGAVVMTRNDSDSSEVSRNDSADSEVSKESKEMMTRNDSADSTVSKESKEMMTRNDSDSEVSKESKEMAEAVDQVIEAQQLPNELLINTMSTISKTKDS